MLQLHTKLCEEEKAAKAEFSAASLPLADYDPVDIQLLLGDDQVTSAGE